MPVEPLLPHEGEARLAPSGEVARRAGPGAPPSAACGQIRRLLEPLVDCELDGVTAAALRAHIATCGGCRSQHREATSVPSRLRALRSPEPPPSLIDEVMRRVAPRSRALDVWGLLVPEVLLVLVAAWYTSGIGGLVGIARRTAGDVVAFLDWGTGNGDPPTPI